MDDAERGLIERIEVIGSPSPLEIGRSVQSEGWSHHELLRTWVASRVSEAEADGRSILVYRFIDAVQETPERLEAVLEAPKDGFDGVRGRVRMSVVHDHLGGRSTVSTPDGQTQTLPLTRGGESGLPTDRSAKYARWTAWSVAGGAVLVLVLYRVRVGRRA
jgi:hypothetical protein